MNMDYTELAFICKLVALIGVLTVVIVGIKVVITGRLEPDLTRKFFILLCLSFTLMFCGAFIFEPLGDKQRDARAELEKQQYLQIVDKKVSAGIFNTRYYFIVEYPDPESEAHPYKARIPVSETEYNRYEIGDKWHRKPQEDKLDATELEQPAT